MNDNKIKMKFYVLEQFTESPEYKISLFMDELKKKIENWFEDDETLKKYEVFSIERDQNNIGTKHSIDIKFSNNESPITIYFMIDESNVSPDGKINEIFVELKIFNEDDNTISNTYNKVIDTDSLKPEIISEFIDNAKDGKLYDDTLASNNTDEQVEDENQ